MSSQTAAFDLPMWCHSLCTKSILCEVWENPPSDYERWRMLWWRTLRKDTLWGLVSSDKAVNIPFLPILQSQQDSHTNRGSPSCKVHLARFSLTEVWMVTEVKLLFTMPSRQTPVDLVLTPPVRIKAQINPVWLKVPELIWDCCLVREDRKREVSPENQPTYLRSKSSHEYTYLFLCIDCKSSLCCLRDLE